MRGNGHAFSHQPLQCYVHARLPTDQGVAARTRPRSRTPQAHTQLLSPRLLAAPRPAPGSRRQHRRYHRGGRRRGNSQRVCAVPRHVNQVGERNRRPSPEGPGSGLALDVAICAGSKATNSSIHRSASESRAPTPRNSRHPEARPAPSPAARRARSPRAVRRRSCRGRAGLRP